jgi:hypothetical protein
LVDEQRTKIYPNATEMRFSTATEQLDKVGKRQHRWSRAKREAEGQSRDAEMEFKLHKGRDSQILAYFCLRPDSVAVAEGL